MGSGEDKIENLTRAGHGKRPFADSWGCLEIAQ